MLGMAVDLLSLDNAVDGKACGVHFRLLGAQSSLVIRTVHGEILMREYETILVVKPDVSDEQLNKLAQRVKQIVDNEGGKFLALANWGKKKLAYEIDNFPKGVFLHANYLSKSATPAELERNLRISDDVIRFMTVQLNEVVDPATREAKEIESLKVGADVEDEDPFRPRRDADSEFGGDEFDGGFDMDEEGDRN